MALYSYNKLIPQRHEIRLCTLHPGSLDDPLSCTLKTVSLDDNPEYESLSYAWGDPTPNRKTKVNEDTMMLTTSLHTALRYLRRPHESRTMWADGICINQHDVDERSSQIGVMGNIYRNAKRLQIWLGEVSEMNCEAGHGEHGDEEPELWNDDDYRHSLKTFLDSQGALTPPLSLAAAASATVDSDVLGAREILELLAENKHFYEMPFFTVTSSLDVQPDPCWYRSLAMLSVILSRPWWSRLWIIQEVVLSSDATVLIGKHEVPFSLFSTSFRRYQDHQSGCCTWCCQLWIGTFFNWDGLDFGRKFLNPLLPVIELYKRNLLALPDLLPAVQNRGASDPHDYVYGIFGLLKDPRLPKPDYDMDIARLYAIYTQKLFLDTKSLFQQSNATSGKTHNPFGLASWACDWSQSTHRYSFGDLYDACKGEEHVLRPTKLQTLMIAVVMTGQISKVGGLIKYDGDRHERKYFNDVVAKLLQWWRLSGHGQSQDVETLLRTIHMDAFITHSTGYAHRVLPDDMEILYRWWKIVVEERRRISPRDGRALWDMNYGFLNMVKDYRFFVTNKGLIGMAPRAIRRNDRVFIAKGSNMPIILRQIRRTSIKNWRPYNFRNGYLFVGQCYVHGIMDGEAVTADTKWETVDVH